MVYRNIKQSLIDLESMFRLLDVQAPRSTDQPGAPALEVGARRDRLRPRLLPLRPAPADPAGRLASACRRAAPSRSSGPSGAGKSTISRLLFRFYDVDDGAHPHRRPGYARRDAGEPAPRHRRRAAGHGAVQRHASATTSPMAGRAPRDDEIEEAARLARIHDFVAALPDGYHSPVGERGLKLSGGEKQRVAIARVILKAPRILVFDEATSALDTKTEREIQTSLEEVSPRPHHPDDRAPAVDRRRRRRDPRARPGPHRRARRSRGAARRRAASTPPCGRASRRRARAAELAAVAD